MPDCVILGCTHFPLVADLFAAALPGGVPIIHQPQATARALKAYLDRHPEYDNGNGGRRIFLSTGFSGQGAAADRKILGGQAFFPAGVKDFARFGRFVLRTYATPRVPFSGAAKQRWPHPRQS